MKKIILIISISILLLTGCVQNEPVKVGISRYAAHGTKAFTLTTVLMKGDKIEKVILDEYQFMPSDQITCVPNGDTVFKDGDGNCLGSKRENNTYYSSNMKDKGDATLELVKSYEAIEEYAKGKTINELVDFINGKDALDIVDAISGSTLVDTKGYIESIIEAANVAE